MAQRMNFPPRKEARQAQALARNEAWAGLTPQQQLVQLTQRGHGHCKQAKRLRKAKA